MDTAGASLPPVPTRGAGDGARAGGAGPVPCGRGRLTKARSQGSFLDSALGAQARRKESPPWLLHPCVPDRVAPHCGARDCH